MNRKELEEREKSHQRTFDAFLQSRQGEIGWAGWASRGLGPPIDFVNAERGIGVELTEWRGQAESQWVEERDRFRNELLTAIQEQGLTAFERGGAGYTAEIHLEDGPPGRGSKAKVIAELLKLLDHFVRTGQSRFSAHGIATVLPSELPPRLRSCVHSITIYKFPTGNLGIVVRNEPLIFDPALPQLVSNVAVDCFRERLREKAITGAARYAHEKERLHLLQLWLVVHYSSPGVFREPLTELAMDIGYGEHRRKSQETVAQKLKRVAQEIGGGPFDRIYFLVDCQPDPFSQLILCVKLQSG